jgi:arylsulfatase A-like enzyme
MGCGQVRRSNVRRVDRDTVVVMPQPNILLITTDQHHYQAMGRKNPLLQTPNLDRLADAGVTVDRAYCPNPTCSPTRSSILTGQYPSSHGCWAIGTKLDEDKPTVSALLGEHGYRTSLIGKAHFQPLASRDGQTSLECMPTLRDLDFWRDFHGPYYGFDHIELARNHADEHWAGQHYAIWLEEQGLTDWRDYFQNADHTNGRRYSWDLPEELHYSTWTAERTMAAIDDSTVDGGPFFCWSSFQDPHPPYLVSEPWASMYDPADVVPPPAEAGELARMHPWFAQTQAERPDFSPWKESPFPTHGFGRQVRAEADLRRDIAVYYGMISFIDQQVGRILDHLDAKGLTENTLVVFTTDHGHFLGQHGLTAKGPFHYEDLLRIPFLARLPGRIPAGSRTESLTSLIDLAPTFLGLAGADVPFGMQGVDQLASWSGGEPARDHLLVEDRFQPTAVNVRSFVEERYKLTVYRGTEHYELFDLIDDPDELENLAGDPKHDQLGAELMHRFVQAEIARERADHDRIAHA